MEVFLSTEVIGHDLYFIWVLLAAMMQTVEGGSRETSEDGFITNRGNVTGENQSGGVCSNKS